MDDFNRTLGQIIARHRKSKHISQEELAYMAEIHRTYLSQIERGLKSATLKVLIRICSQLDVKLSTIIEELEQRL